MNATRESGAEIPFDEQRVTGYLDTRREEIIDEAVAETRIPVANLREEFQAALEAVNNLPDIYQQYRRRLDVSSEAFENDYEIVPKGTVAIITPWNTPLLSQIFLPTLSLAVGNETVLKPSTNASTTSEYVESALQAAHETEAVPLSVRSIPGSEFAAQLDTDWVDYVYYMGAREIGRKIRDRYDGEFFGEYEANNVAIVTEYDTEYIDFIVGASVDKSGVDCDNLRGVFVADKAYDRFVTALERRATELRVGNPADFETDISRTLAPDGFEILPNPDPETKFEPEMKPKLWIEPYESDDDLRAMLDGFFDHSPYGLSTMVLSKTAVDEWVEYLRTATPTTRICVNKPSLEFIPHAPWGGRGLTANGGAKPWVEKFSDVICIEGDWPR